MWKILKLINQKNKINWLDLLDIIEKESIKIAFFDPQYRWVLDKMWYWNEGIKRWKSRSDLPQMDEEIIEKFIEKIEKVLLPNWYLFLWIDKFHLLEWVKKWFDNLESLSIVDMITWDKQKIWMWYRTRRKSLGIDYDKILEIRKKDAEENFNYFISEMIKVQKVKEWILYYLEK